MIITQKTADKVSAISSYAVGVKFPSFERNILVWFPYLKYDKNEEKL